MNNFGSSSFSNFSTKIGLTIIVVSFLNGATVMFMIFMINHNILIDDKSRVRHIDEPDQLEIELEINKQN